MAARVHTSAASVSASSTRVTVAVRVTPRRLTPVSTSTARAAAARSTHSGPSSAYAAKVSAIVAQDAVLPTTKPQPATNPHHSPSRSRP